MPPLTERGNLTRDDSDAPVMGGTSSVDDSTIVDSAFDPVTRRLLTTAPGAMGTVTSVSVVSANGFAGSVADATTTPAITLSTTVTGLLKGNGTAISAAVANTDYQSPITLTTTGTSGVATFDGTTLNVPDYGSAGAALTIGSTVVNSGTTTRILYDNAGVLGEYSVIPVSLGGTNATSASITAFNNITGYTASGATGTTSTNLVFSTSPVLTTPNIGAATADSLQAGTSSSGVLLKNNAGTTVASFGVGSSSSTNISLAGTVALGSNNITMTGSIASTGSRVTKLWATDIESTNMPTVGGTSLSSTFLGLAGGTMTGNITLGENTSIALDPAGSADGKYTGITVTGTAGYTQAFGDLVYLAVADSRWELADADAASTAGPVMLAMVVSAGTDGNPCTLLLQGIIRADAKFPTMTVGATQYVGETAGAIQGTIPTGADNVIRTIGYALTADSIYFNPSTDWQITVA